MPKLTSAIHVAKAQLGLDDDTYRAFLQSITGKQSCAKMNDQEKWRVMEALKERGFTKKSTRKGHVLPADPQAKKIRALWLMMASAGIVHNRAEEALDAYVKRICGCGLEDASVKQCQAVIETLKKWIDRVEDQTFRDQLLDILRGDSAEAIVIGGNIVVGARHVIQ